MDNVSLRVECGEVAAVLGPNGSGKSTLLHIAGGVMRPTLGRVSILGRDVGEPSARRVLGFLPQEDPLYPHLTGRENIRVLASMKDVEPDWSLVERAVKLLGLGPHLDRRVSEYSGGMARKLALLAILAQHPRVLILDEPTSGLDPASRKIVARLLREAAEDGAAVLYSTHIGSDAEEADMVAFMLNGRIVATGSPRELVERFTPGIIAEVQVENVEGFVEACKGEGFEVQREREVLRVRVQDEAALAALVELASRHGLSSFHARRPGLEDAFLAATGVRLYERV